MYKLFSASASRVLMVVLFLGLHHTVATRSTPLAASRIKEKINQVDLPTFPARSVAADTDGDGVTDATDADDDNDGILDSDEMKYILTKTVIPDDIPASSPDGIANSFANGNYSGLNKPGLNSETSWSAASADDSYFVGVVFPEPAKISSIDIRERGNGGQWVESFTLEGTKESVATGSQGTTNTWISLGTFTGNSDQQPIVTHQINSTESNWRAIRIVPKTWHDWPSLRFAVNIYFSDRDQDGKDDWLDTDSDGDGLSDNEESQPTGSRITPSGTDTDRDGVDNAYDPDNGGKTIVPVDTDGDSTPDYKDTDSDGDTILDKNESTDGNSNGTPDYKEKADADGDGVGDLHDSDDDGDGISDIEETGCGSSQYSFTSLAQVQGMPSGRYSFDLGKGVFQADVDDSEGGGWVLVLQYVHKGTTNPALKVLTAGANFPVTSTAALGTDESTQTTKWGHAGNAALSQFTEDFEIRFHGATDAHVRIIHFKAIPGSSTETAHTAYVKTGTGEFTGINTTSKHTLLTGHTAMLPASVDTRFKSKGDKALTNFPFYTEGKYHWGIAGGSNSNRWEVDDFPGKPGGQSGSKNSTTHRVWVRSATLPLTVACSNEADSDKDGIPDRTDGDSDGDGIADKDEIGTPPTGKDTDGDGIDDAYDADNGGQPKPKDTDGDGVPDYLDADADNDGITDGMEGQTTGDHKTPSGTDANKNGIDDVYEGLTPIDTDGDKIPDFKDTDADGDNAPDWIEGFDNDGSGDAMNDLIGRANAFKAAGGDASFYNNSTNSDSDKIPDWLEDTNNDGKPNFLDKTSPHYHDSDGDGLVDLYDTNSKGTAANPPKASTTSTELAFRDASTDTTLPVELLSFEATAKGGHIWVTWATATEENSDRFEIYRSTDGATWSQTGTVRSAGSSQAKLSYTFTDREPYEGVSYYRLRMVDFDGKEDVSPVRQVTVGQSLSKTDVKVWPNPNEGYFTISITHASSSPALLTLYSMVGNVVWEKELSSEQTDEVVAGNIQAGTYLLHVSNATGVTVVKIIVQ